MLTVNKIFLLVIFSLSCCACQQVTEESLISLTNTNDKILYVSTGACYSGQGVTTYSSSTAARTIERFLVATGASQGPIFDYSSVLSGMPALMSPAKISDAGLYLYVLNEGGTGQRNLIRLPKANPYNYTTIIANNSTAFTSTLLSFTVDDEGSYLISKGTSIEKFNSTASRLTASGAAWINAPGGNCAAATTSMTAVLTLPASSGVAGHVIFSHQGTTSGTNRLGIIYGGTGYINTSNCLSGVNISAVTHTKASNLSSGTIAFVTTGTSPSSMILVPYSSGTVKAKLIVSYSNSQTYNAVSGTVTTLNHGIVAWDVSQPSASTASLSNPIVLVEDYTKVFAVSAMAYDQSDNSLYIAVGGVPGSSNQTTGGVGYNIEKYTLDLSTAATTGPTLTRVGTQPFILGGSNTKCISGLAVGE